MFSFNIRLLLSHPIDVIFKFLHFHDFYHEFAAWKWWNNPKKISKFSSQVARMSPKKLCNMRNRIEIWVVEDQSLCPARADLVKKGRNFLRKYFSILNQQTHQTVHFTFRLERRWRRDFCEVLNYLKLHFQRLFIHATTCCVINHINKRPKMTTEREIHYHKWDWELENLHF